MALKGDERRLIAEANMHLPGRQVDPRQVQRDIWRLGRWERERLERRAARPAARPRGVDPVEHRPPPGTVSFDLKHRSRALTEGRDRAAARAYLKGIGYDDEALCEADHRRRQHVDRDDAVQLPPARARRARSRTASAPPAARRWSSTRSRSPTASRWARAGMKTSLVSREVIADSIELVARGHLFDAVIALCAAATRRSPAP